MLVVQKANNGQAVAIKKDFSELTNEELNALELKGGEKATDYSTFYISYNKKGELKHVRGLYYSAKKWAKIDKEEKEKSPVDLWDYLTILTPKATTKAQRITASKHFNRAEKLGF
ncbi:MAG: hypothetical protein [Caudoviricetes sp.]|nr:MAG: hypothetical protein [Caudoviricetes sp.]